MNLCTFFLKIVTALASTSNIMTSCILILKETLLKFHIISKMSAVVFLGGSPLLPYELLFYALFFKCILFIGFPAHLLMWLFTLILYC